MLIVGHRGRERGPVAGVVVGELIVGIAVGAADRAGVAHRQPQPPALAQRAGVGGRAGGERARQRRATAMIAGAGPRRDRARRRAVDVDHDRGAQREPRPVHRVDRQVARRQHRQAGDLGQPLQRDLPRRWLGRVADLDGDARGGRGHGRLDRPRGVGVERVGRGPQRRLGQRPRERRPQRRGVADDDRQGPRPVEVRQAQVVRNPDVVVGGGRGRAQVEAAGGAALRDRGRQRVGRHRWAAVRSSPGVRASVQIRARRGGRPAAPTSWSGCRRRSGPGSCRRSSRSRSRSRCWSTPRPRRR